MFHIAIVEDEPIYRQQLKSYIEQYSRDTGTAIRISEFSDGEDVLDGYTGNYDMILLDIQMKFMDGMTAAEEIRKRDTSVIIMFITNMTQYAVQGYQVNALDYIVKPVEYFAFRVRMDKAIERLGEREKHFIRIPVEDGVVRLEVETVYYIESRGHLLRYKTRNGEYEARGVLGQVEEMLAPYGFFSCNKGILVNMGFVEGVRENVCIIQGEQVPISRRKKKLFLDKLLDFVNEVL